MRHYIYLITTFLLLFCVGCGSAESLDGNTSPQEPYQGSSAEDAFDGSNSSSRPNDLEEGKGFDEKPDNKPESDGTEENKNGNQETGNMNKEEIEYVAVQTEHIYEEYVDRETQNPLVYMNYQVISLEEGNETLKQTVSKWMVKRQQDLEEDGLELMVKAKSKQKEMDNTALAASLWHEITLYRVDERLISFVERQYTYSIDAWNNDYRCVNFDVESGNNLLLHDLVVDKEGFRSAVISYCVELLENSYTNSEIDESAVAEIYQSIIAIGNWCLDASGFVFVYEDDELQYSNEGVLFVHIPYAVVMDYVNSKYIWGDVYGIAALTYDQKGAIVVDDVEYEICVEHQHDAYDMELPKLFYGDTVIEMSQHMRTSNMYLICHENWNYLAMAVDMASANYQTYFYPLLEQGIGKVFALDGALDAANVRADSFDLSKRVDVFGTYQTYPEYVLVENGTVAAYRSDYEIMHTNYEWCELVTVRELPVMKDSMKTILPTGSKMRILSTDNVSWAKFLLLDTLEEVIVQFQREENYSLSVEGISEFDYFEELPYPG